MICQGQPSPSRGSHADHAEGAIFSTLDKYVVAFQKLTTTYLQERIYDIKDRTQPRQIGHYKSQGSHRFDSDGNYAYISSEEEGFVGDIVVILDLADPARPEPVAR